MVVLNIDCWQFFCRLQQQVHGTADGGDCDELRLLSDESTFINLRAHGGSFSFLGTKVVIQSSHSIQCNSQHFFLNDTPGTMTVFHTAVYRYPYLVLYSIEYNRKAINLSVCRMCSQPSCCCNHDPCIYFSPSRLTRTRYCCVWWSERVTNIGFTYHTRMYL